MVALPDPRLMTHGYLVIMYEVKESAAGRCGLNAGIVV